MSEPNKIDLRADRRFATGMGVFGGMLSIIFVQNAMQMNLIGSAACLAGIAALAVLYRWLERDIPRGVNTIASKAAHLKDSARKGLRDYLRDDD